MRKKLTKTEFLMFILLAPFIRPNGLYAIIHKSQYIYDILSVCSLSSLVVLYAWQLHKGFTVCDRQLVYVCLLFLIISISTIKYHQDIMVHLRIAVTCIGMMFFVKVFSDYPKSVISITMLEMEVLIYANLLCMVLFPHGMYLSHGTYGASNNWLMGYDNHWFIFYYGAYYLAVMSSLCGGSKIRSFLLIVVLHVTTLYVFSGVLVLGLILLDLIYMFGIYKKKWFNLKIIMLVGILATVLLVFSSTNETIQYLIKSVFNKEDSIQARGRIWTQALNMYMENPVIGNGRWYEAALIDLYGLPAAVNAHNMWLELLYEGGILGVSVFLMAWIALSRRKKNRGVFYCMTLVPLAIILIVMSVDAFIETRGVMLFFLLAIACNSEKYEPILKRRNRINDFNAHVIVNQIKTINSNYKKEYLT